VNVLETTNVSTKFACNSHANVNKENNAFKESVSNLKMLVGG
jgi:hypothetical protein